MLLLGFWLLSIIAYNIIIIKDFTYNNLSNADLYLANRLSVHHFDLAALLFDLFKLFGSYWSVQNNH